MVHGRIRDRLVAVLILMIAGVTGMLALATPAMATGGHRAQLVPAAIHETFGSSVVLGVNWSDASAGSPVDAGRVGR